MPQVAVIYGTPDRSGEPKPDGWHVTRVPWDDRLNLLRDHVLSIAIVHDEKGPKDVNKKRRQAVCEYDFYVLAWDRTSCYLGGYNDDFYWFSLTEPWKKYGEGFIHRFPYKMLRNSITFEGLMVSKEQYLNARAAFKDQKGPMFQ